MELKFGQEPTTKFYNNLAHLKVELVDAPTRSQALNVAWQYVKATWADHHDHTNPGTASLQELSANLITSTWWIHTCYHQILAV